MTKAQPSLPKLLAALAGGAKSVNNLPLSGKQKHCDNEDDIDENESIKKNFVPGLKVGKIGLEKTLEEKLIGSNDIERYEVNAYGRRIRRILGRS